jgi:6-pyruvoyltetrahydropterin/6-carboxytetrahydropterin synthase
MNVHYEIFAEESFDSAHFLRDYPGKCSNIHGHRWRVVAELSSPGLQNVGAERGMLMDFSRLKAGLRELVFPLDHCLIIEEGSLRPELLSLMATDGFVVCSLPFRPTAENLAHFFFKRLRALELPVATVTVYETPTLGARYGENNVPDC